MALRRALHRRGLRYRLQGRPLPSVRATVDIVFPRARVAVQVQGCFWHQCPEHRTAPRANAEWWSAKLARNVERDLATARALADEGWELVIVWEHEDPERAADRVAELVRSRRPSRGLPDGPSTAKDGASQPHRA